MNFHKKIFYQISFRAIQFLSFIALRLSKRARVKLGGLFGDLYRIVDIKRRRIAYDNLSKSFPDKDKHFIKTTMKEAYRSFAATFVELSIMDKLSDEELLSYLKIENFEILENALKEGKGAIMLSAHYGNWELLAYIIPFLLKKQFRIVAKRQRNYLIDNFINSIRQSRGNIIVYMRDAARGIITSLRNNEAVAMIVDQAATADKDVFIEFFGRLASTHKAPANIALHFGSPMVMCLGERQKDCTYLVKTYRIKSDDLANTPEGIQELTRRHVEILENQIRKTPGQWLWTHRRWKRAPGGDMSIKF